MQSPAREALPPAFADGKLAALVDAWLREFLARRAQPSNLREALEYAALGAGKRVRPVLLLESCRALGGHVERALPAAAAIECVHAFSLVHDDLPALDDDDLRRGRATLHKHSGEAMAILAGDALFGLAFEIIACEVPEAALAGRLCRELARAANDMIAGQVYDTCPDWPAGIEGLERLTTIHRHKTGALITGACRLGALCAEADSNRLQALTRYASAVGLMFQVVDDLLDVTQTTEQLGKAARKDEQQGKLTYPSLLGVEESRRVVADLRGQAVAHLEPLGAAAADLRDLAEWLAVRTR
jgi:geranylgeranyl diphosphate synthase type II